MIRNADDVTAAVLRELERVQGGARLAGTYPPSEETKAAFAVWRKERGI